MKVRDSEMEHLGYIVPMFMEHLSPACKRKLYRERYLYETIKPEYVPEVMVFTDLEKAVSYRGKKIALFAGDAYFRDSKITSLGELTSIGGDVYRNNIGISHLLKKRGLI